MGNPVCLVSGSSSGIGTAIVEGFAASGLNLREGFFATRLVDIDNHDFGPFFGEERGGGPAHARAGAGDQGNLSGECGHFHSPVRQKKTSGRLFG